MPSGWTVKELYKTETYSTVPALEEISMTSFIKYSGIKNIYLFLFKNDTVFIQYVNTKTYARTLQTYTHSLFLEIVILLFMLLWSRI
jgi:hypothetical protein